MQLKIELSRLLLLLTLSLLISLLIAVFFLIPKNAPKTLSDKELAQVPELVTILSSDKDARLKAAYQLAERVGVEEALEIVNSSSLPHTGEGHLAVHQIGLYAYKKYGKDAILHCKDYFLYACYHGVIIEAATNSGFVAISQMADTCKSYASRYFQCVHASGHAIMAIWNYELPRALSTCDQLFEYETQFVDTLTSCHNGAFMENLFGVHDFDKGTTPKRNWLSEDVHFPCNYFSAKYQKGCWLNQAARIYQMNQGNIPKTSQICQQIGNDQYSQWCLDNLARQIHPLTEGNIAKVFSLCEQMGISWRENCVIVNAGSYYSVGDRKTAIYICNQIPYLAKYDCYSLITSQIVIDNISDSDKKQLCLLMDQNYEAECVKTVSG